MFRPLIMGRLRGVFVGALALCMSSAANAVIIQVGPSSLIGAPVIDYGLVQTFAPVDGVTFGGVLHNFSVGGSPSGDAVIDGGPGGTNNITVANIEGDATGVLSFLFPSKMNLMGFGWAQSAGTSTTIELFDPLNASLGTSTFVGAADPTFIGGFAGVLSTIPFLRAEVTFDGAGRFAFDNLRFAVPEPATIATFGLGLLGLGLLRRRRNPRA